jgi:hypothetical protein
MDIIIIIIIIEHKVFCTTSQDNNGITIIDNVTEDDYDRFTTTTYYGNLSAESLHGSRTRATNRLIIGGQYCIIYTNYRKCMYSTLTNFLSTNKLAWVFNGLYETSPTLDCLSD